jgi:23S rRNA (cytosine1962-C5)-methyltransferase
VFRDSIASIEGDPAPGDPVSVVDAEGRPIGGGFLSPGSQIAVRILARPGDGPAGEGAEPGRAFFVERLERARRLREETLALPILTDGYRLVHSEGDGLPGLVLDHYASHLVAQFSTIGMHRRRDLLLDAMEEVFGPASIWERPDRKACELEGLPAGGGLLRGETPAEPPSILEHGLQFRIHVGAGHKTGFYADQRDNRRLVGSLARDRAVLDLHTYTGGFGLYAATNGAAEVLAIDTSGPSLALAAENAMLNNVRQLRFERVDASELLNDLHKKKRRFGIVVSDPPRLARERGDVGKALRAYRDLHLRAMRVVESGGLLAASSCSGSVSEQEFEQTLREAAYDLGRSARIVARGGQAPDHPVLATCPEGRYLMFLLACID